jgi:hypothetical protein
VPKKKIKKKVSYKNRFALNLSDMTYHTEDIGFKLLVVPKLTREVVDIYKNRIDGTYVLLDDSLPSEQLKATCEIAAGNYRIRCYHHTGGRWTRVKGKKIGSKVK